jgi:methylenetetrahydrofolate reductase (NADPH)
VSSVRELLAAAAASGTPTVSVEFFPPKTPEGAEQLHRTVDELVAADLSFVSVTYGAGGSTRDRTRDLVVELQAERPYPAVAHLTCIGHTRADLEALLADYDDHGVHNILALAGDPPADGSPATGDFTHALELVELVRARGDHMSVGVAAHPELHPRSPDRVSDRRHLAEKLSRSDFGITQFFFDAVDYRRMVDELAELGCTTPVLPGIMPVTNPVGVRRMGAMAGATVPEALVAKVEAAEGEDRRRIAVDAAVELCRDLLADGVPGLHLYCLNRAETALDIVNALNLRP